MGEDQDDAQRDFDRYAREVKALRERLGSAIQTLKTDLAATETDEAEPES